MSEPQSFEDYIGATRSVADASFPAVIYDAAGDCLEVILMRDDFKTIRLDERLSLMVSREQHSPVGVLVKDVVKSIRRTNPTFDLGEPIRVDRLLSHYLFSLKLEQGSRRQLEGVIERVEESRPEVVLSCG